MKLSLIGVLLILGINTMASEQLQYKTLYQAENIEIRHYQRALFATVSSPGRMFDNRNNNFSKLAGYIFGGNEDSQKISMTSPVTMKEEKDSSVMSFMVPSRWKKEDLPAPNNQDIRFEEKEAFYALTITFGGYSNADKYDTYRKKLIEFASEHNIGLTNEVYLLGYDPPFKIMGRRNDVLIVIKHLPAKFSE